MNIKLRKSKLKLSHLLSLAFLCFLGYLPLTESTVASPRQSSKQTENKAHNQIASAPVTYIRSIDGDTIVVKLNGKTEHVRLIGIDAPEKEDNKKARRDVERTGQDLKTILAMGAKAKDQLSTFLRNAQTLTLEFDIEKRDRYGRLLAYVYLNDKTFINKMMLTEGFAQPLSIPPNLRYKDEFLTAARKARQEKKGLWQEQ